MTTLERAVAGLPDGADAAEFYRAIAANWPNG